MHVRVNQASADVPIGETFQLKANGIQDLMSGASPIFNAPGPAGKPQQVLTGASVNDNRKAGDIGASAFFDDNQLTLRQGWSHENDYKSTWTSLEGKRDFNQKDTTLSLGLAFSDDGVSSHDAPGRFSYPHQARSVCGRDAGPGRALARFRVARVFVHQRLPVRPLQARLRAERRTASRHAARPGAAVRGNREVRYLPSRHRFRAAFDGRRSAATTGASIRVRSSCSGGRSCPPNGWSMPARRFYTQSSADFYAPLYLSPPGDTHSSDYRLAGFGSIAWLAGVTKQLSPNFSIQFAAERNYRRVGVPLRRRRHRRRQLHLDAVPGDRAGPLLTLRSAVRPAAFPRGPESSIVRPSAKARVLPRSAQDALPLSLPFPGDGLALRDSSLCARRGARRCRGAGRDRRRAPSGSEVFALSGRQRYRGRSTALRRLGGRDSMSTMKPRRCSTTPRPATSRAKGCST